MIAASSLLALCTRRPVSVPSTKAAAASPIDGTAEPESVGLAISASTEAGGEHRQVDDDAVHDFRPRLAAGGQQAPMLGGQYLRPHRGS